MTYNDSKISSKSEDCKDKMQISQNVSLSLSFNFRSYGVVYIAVYGLQNRLTLDLFDHPILLSVENLVIYPIHI
jgi:hypothetical protein